MEGRQFTCNLKDWEVFCIADEYNTYNEMMFKPIESLIDENGQRIPGAYRATFDVRRPGDTFLNFETWGKGLVYVNGHAMGRIWEIGPQQTLYMPGCWLKKGENEIIVFDIAGPREAVCEGLEKPVIDMLQLQKPKTHREEGENLDLSGYVMIHEGSFDEGNGWQEIIFDEVTEGRQLCLEAISSHDGKDLACVAELYILDEEGKRIPREQWTVSFADSEEVTYANRAADKCFDLQESTFWSTAYGATFPHSIVIDMGGRHKIGGLQYLPRMESSVPGALKDFRIYVK